MRRKLSAMVLPFVLAPLLAGCGGASGGKVQSANTPVQSKPAARKSGTRIPATRQPATRPPPAPQIQKLPGLEGVIGSTTAELSRQFGTARLDVIEGDARKLQFVGDACVLDVYLYPSAAGREPQATYVDARRASDGQDVDRAACIAALQRR